MKMKTKNISLIIATAIFVLSGITGAVAQTEKSGKIQVEIKNNLKFGVDLEISSNDLNRGKSIKQSIAAGESKIVEENALPSMPSISVEPSKGQKMTFTTQGGQYWNTDKPGVVKVDVLDDTHFLGTFTVVAKLTGNTLKIVIDSKDADLKPFKGTMDL